MVDPRRRLHARGTDTVRGFAVACSMVLLLGSSCAGAGSPPAAGAGGAQATGKPAAAADYAVRVGAAGEGLQWTAFYVAESAGFFKEEHVKVELVQAAAAESLQAVLTGAAEVATGSIHVTQAKAAGRNVKAFGAILSQFGASLVLSNKLIGDFKLTPGSTIGDVVKAIKGRKIGSSSPGSAIDVLMRGLLRDYGLNPATDLTLVPLGAAGSGYVAGLQRGDLDGFIYVAPWPDVAETQGLGKVVVNLYAGDYAAFDGIYFNTLYGTAEFAQTTNPAAMAFARAVEKSLRFIAAKPNEASKIVRAHFSDLPQAAFDLAWGHVLPALPKTLTMEDRGFQLNVKLALALDPKAKMDIQPKDIYSNAIPTEVSRQLDAAGWKP